MSEFCLDCVNKIFDKNLTEENVLLEENFCEECMEIKPCVMRVCSEPRKAKSYKKLFFFTKK